MQYDLNRQPLYETVKKHATSKRFLTAIVCNFIYICACWLFFTFFFVETFNIFSFYGMPTVPLFLVLGYFAIIALGSIIISAVMNLKLLKVRNYFLGTESDHNGLSEYTKTVKISYLYTGIATGIPMVITIVATVFVVAYDGGASDLMSLFFVLPLYAAEIAGIVILYYFTFKSIRNTVDYAVNATNNIADGKVSVFLIVLSIISLVGSAISVFYTGTAALLIAVFKNVFLEEMAFAAPVSSLLNIIYLMPLVTVPMLISNICYVKIIFGFKNDMEFAKKEHAWLEAMRSGYNQGFRG